MTQKQALPFSPSYEEQSTKTLTTASGSFKLQISLHKLQESGVSTRRNKPFVLSLTTSNYLPFIGYKA